MLPKDENGKFMVTDVDYLETWSGMEDALAQGLTKSIGVSNFNAEQMQRIIDNSKTKPVTNQVLYTMLVYFMDVFISGEFYSSYAEQIAFVFRCTPYCQNFYFGVYGREMTASFSGTHSRCIWKQREKAALF